MTKANGSIFYRDLNWDYPEIVYGQGIYLYDNQGNKYLDACSGSAVANLGHGNKEVAKAMAEQAEKLAYIHSSRFISKPTKKLALKIAELSPGDLNTVYFVSGGSEATETAIKLCRQYYIERDGISSKYKIISRWRSYHGNTLGALSISGKPELMKKYKPLLNNFPHIAPPYCYRCEFRLCPENCNCECAMELEKAILREGPENVAGFIFEPVIGSAAPGAFPNKEYFAKVKEICDKYDVLLIADEVMNGFGRTGRNFGVDNFDFIPDIICFAKGVSSGYSPLGGVVVSDKIISVFKKGSGKFIHGHTYSGNPLSCAVGCKVLDIIKRDNIVENSRVMGEYLLSRLKSEFENNPYVGDIRGKGLQIGIEFVQDKGNKEPFDKNINLPMRITEKGLNNGIVLYPCVGSIEGIKGDNILLTPPLIINKEQVDELVLKLKISIEQAIDELI